MSQEGENTGLAILFVKFVLANAGSYLLFNYDKVLGAIFTTLSIVYVYIKIMKELKSKNNGITKD